MYVGNVDVSDFWGCVDILFFILYMRIFRFD